MILAMDTSTYVLGVAVGDGQTVRAEWTTHEKTNHSLRLMPGIDLVLKSAGLKPRQLSTIAVTTGPGSYTGVRIGVSTAKAMASSLNVPLVEVSTLETLASNGKYREGLVCSFIDARRGQVYAGVYEVKDEALTVYKEERLLLLEDLLQELKKRGRSVLFLSLDVDLHRETLTHELGEHAIFGATGDNRTKPSEVLRIASQKEAATNVDAVVPRYLQLAEAEKNIKKESSS
ncbi:LOW QUALITY PROTEIN: inactive homolog of metal-dependent protease [Geomicrobium sp. JCM 19055]|nr:LOW QUALITY PROTEIN: inactive homolog of metal-dependent protease [Geomicrobium sp. JCM 19055]